MFYAFSPIRKSDDVFKKHAVIPGTSFEEKVEVFCCSFLFISRAPTNLDIYGNNF